MNTEAPVTHRTPIIVILGVHRSGTSLTTNIVKDLGAELGGPLIPGRGDNKKGFFEHQGILHLSRALDHELGIDPFGDGALVPPANSWWLDEAFADSRATLGRLLTEQTSANGKVFAFKDPRTLYLLPFYEHVFENLNLEPFYVLCLRDPEDNIGSLGKRNISRDRARGIYLAQLTEAIRTLKSKPGITVRYERWFTDPKAQLRELADALPVASIDDAQLESCLHEIEADLRHFRDGAAKQHDDAAVADLYAALEREADGQCDWADVRYKAEIINSAMRAASVETHAGADNNVAQTTIDQLRRESKRLRGKLIKASMASEGDNAGFLAVMSRPADPYNLKFSKLSQIRATSRNPARPLKVCIATEDIVGPIRNGGIGTTYTHLSFLLADAGHDVTIAYLRGDHVENETIDHWVEWYSEKGVRFVPVAATEHTRSTAPRWLGGSYAMLRFLLAEHFDLVHVSEWRGSGYFSLLAKKQGIAFDHTIFCVKSSSPWLWNREYGLQPVQNESDLIKMHLERRSIELGDLVIGGSAHLLRWMAEHGYKLPGEHTYVQPNVMVAPDIGEAANIPRPERGTRVPVQEIVFFGRLEGRKGLDIFCQAIDQLSQDASCSLPPITFLGKFGARIMSHPQFSIEEYIEDKARAWGCEWKILSNCGQAEALGYLHGEGRLAVMPSVIENSSLAVYEAVHFTVPFIASDVGGTSELIEKADCANVLVKPHPVPLAMKLKTALNEGAYVAQPSFDNEKNLSEWLNWHSTMSVVIDGDGWPQTDEHKKSHLPPELVSACMVVHDNHQSLEPCLDGLRASDYPNLEIILVDDGSRQPETRNWLRQLAAADEDQAIAVSVVRTRHFGFSAALNKAAAQANGSHLVFVSPGSKPYPNMVSRFAGAATRRPATAFVSFYCTREADHVMTEVAAIGDVPGSFLGREREFPFLFIDKQTFNEAGGFAEDYQLPGAQKELLAECTLRNAGVEIVPDPLGEIYPDMLAESHYDHNAAIMRVVRPFTRHVPLSLLPMWYLLLGYDIERVNLTRTRNQREAQLARTGPPPKPAPVPAPNNDLQLVAAVLGENAIDYFRQNQLGTSPTPHIGNVAFIVHERLPGFLRRPFRLLLRLRRMARGAPGN